MKIWSKMQGLRLVTFDMVGTVIKFSRHPVMDYVEIGQRHGIKAEFDSIAKSFAKQWADHDRALPHFGATSVGITSRLWWLTLVEGTFKNSLGHAAFNEEAVRKAAEELYDHFASPKAYAVLDDGKEAMKKAKDLGLQVGVITNFDVRIHSILKDLRISELCDFVVTSEEAESSKPEENIFNFAQSKSYLVELKPSEVLHIGDDYSKVTKELNFIEIAWIFRTILGPRQLDYRQYWWTGDQAINIFLKMPIKTGGVNFVRTALQMTWSQM